MVGFDGWLFSGLVDPNQTTGRATRAAWPSSTTSTTTASGEHFCIYQLDFLAGFLNS